MEPQVWLGIVLGFVVVSFARAVWTAAGPLRDVLRNAQGISARLAKLEGERVVNPGAAIADLSERLDRAERKIAGMDLAVLDTAEKVAARLSDRERKRSARSASSEDDLDDEAAWWARARAAHPLPGMPTDTAQLPLLPLSEDES